MNWTIKNEKSLEKSRKETVYNWNTELQCTFEEAGLIIKF